MVVILRSQELYFSPDDNVKSFMVDSAFHFVINDSCFVKQASSADGFSLRETTRRKNP